MKLGKLLKKEFIYKNNQQTVGVYFTLSVGGIFSPIHRKFIDVFINSWRSNYILQANFFQSERFQKTEYPLFCHFSGLFLKSSLCYINSRL